MQHVIWALTLVLAALFAAFAAHNEAVIRFDVWPFATFYMHTYTAVLGTLVVGVGVGWALCWLRYSSLARRDRGLAKTAVTAETHLAPDAEPSPSGAPAA